MVQTVTILGINGRIGKEVAKAFVAAKWRVIGMGRGNRARLESVEFVNGDVNMPEDTLKAVSEADVVVNALNLPYDKWDKGRAEAQLEKVLTALKGSGKTLIFPGNIYNYGADQLVLTPDTPQRPERDKGRIRQRLEAMLAQAAQEGLRVIIVRSGDFYAPNASQTVFDLMLLRQIKRGIIEYAGELPLGHSWAYLPDVARAYVKIAEQRTQFSSFESFHFAGHFTTGNQMVEAIQDVLPTRARVKKFPWGMLKIMGLFMPVLRELVKMNYLWKSPHRLEDKKLDALLGPDFNTPFKRAVAITVRSYLPES